MRGRGCRAQGAEVSLKGMIGRDLIGKDGDEQECEQKERRYSTDGGSFGKATRYDPKFPDQSSAAQLAPCWSIVAAGVLMGIPSADLRSLSMQSVSIIVIVWGEKLEDFEKTIALEMDECV